SGLPRAIESDTRSSTLASAFAQTLSKADGSNLPTFLSHASHLALASSAVAGASWLNLNVAPGAGSAAGAGAADSPVVRAAAARMGRIVTSNLPERDCEFGPFRKAGRGRGPPQVYT